MKRSFKLAQVLRELVLFILIFILISGIMGTWVIRSRLLYGFGFFIYGNLGKIVILSGLILPYLLKDRVNEIPRLTQGYRKRLFLPAAVGAILIFFNLANRLLSYQAPSENWTLFYLTHACLLLSPLFALLGTFGICFIRDFTVKFHKTLVGGVVMALILDFGIFGVWELWPYFSAVVLLSVKFLLSLTFREVYFYPPWTLGVGGFAAQILQACSGLDSIFMFSALYFLVGIIDRKELHVLKYFLAFLPLGIGLFALNIFRVYMIYVIGILISPAVALELFHTYAGMVLFIFYFLGFLKFFYPQLKIRKIAENNTG